MFFHALGQWLRAALAIAVLVGAGLLLRGWADALPREAFLRDPLTGSVEARPLGTLAERAQAWTPRRDTATARLAGALALLAFALAGRFLSPRLWAKRGAPPRPEAPRRTHRLKSRTGHELQVEEYGSVGSPPLVLTHGLGCDGSVWREAVQDLSDEFHVFVWDLPGHGRSSRLRPPWEVDDAARDLDEVIGLAGEEDLVLAGHSFGGMTAMRWVARHPKRARSLAGLVLVHTTPQDPFQTMTPVALHRALERPIYGPLLGITPALAPLLRVAQWLEYLNGTTHWQTAFTAFGGCETREQLDRVARLQARMDPAATARLTRAAMRFDVRKALDSIAVPTVVVAGEKDPVTRPEASRAIAGRVPDAELVVLGSTRHLGFLEQRRRFAQEVSRFGSEGRRRRPAAATAR